MAAFQQPTPVFGYARSDYDQIGPREILQLQE